MGETARIVSLASAVGPFTRGLRRLEASLEAVGYRGETDFYGPGRFPRSCPSHLEAPFAFKPFCLREAGERGATIVLWLDSRCVAVAPLDPIWRRIESDGYVLFENGTFRVGEWAADLALDALGTSRGEAMGLPEVNAAAIGLDLRHARGRAFLDAWLEHARRGVAFRGVDRPLADAEEYRDVKWNRGGRVSRDPRVRGHRHDQTVAGVLAHRLGLALAPDGLRGYDRLAGIVPGTCIVVDRTGKLTVAGIERARRRGARRSWVEAVRRTRGLLQRLGVARRAARGG